MGHLWRFGDCELDEAGRVLRVAGVAVEIEAKPFEVLRALVLHAGEVVTKTDLLEMVWPGVSVVDGSLATAVSKVRKALGDDARAVVTVPRIGYKLSVPVTCTGTPPARGPSPRSGPGDAADGEHTPLSVLLAARSAAPSPSPAIGGRRASGWRLWLPLGSLAAMVAALAGVSMVRQDPSIGTVAVLPLQNLRSDDDLEFLERALADEIATALTHGHRLHVRPVPAPDAMKDGRADLRTTGRELGAESVVTGRFFEEAERLHVTLQAIDVETDRAIWSDAFAAPADNLVALQMQIALRVRGGLARALGSPATDAAFEPRNEEAYELYLRGVALPLGPAHNAQALGMLERAVALDPGYPPAWLALGRRYYVEGRYGTGDRSMMSRYEAALERALSLDPEYVAAGAGLIVSQVERGDLASARRRADALVARRPDSADAQFVLSYVLRYAGLLDQAAERCDRALVLDRKMQTNGLRTCAMVFLLRGDYGRTANYLQLDQGSDFSKAITIDMLARQGRLQEALAAPAPGIPTWKSYDVLRACLAGAPAARVAELTGTVQASGDPELDYFAGAHLAYCGQTAASIDLLKRAIAGHYCSYPALERDPLLAGLRDTSEYAELRAAGRACQQEFLSATVR